MRFLVPLIVAGLLAACGRPSALPTPAVRSDEEQVLDAIVRDVLNSDFLKEARADYGTPGDKRLALVSNAESGLPWPEGYRPVIPNGYEVRRVSEGTRGAEDQPRMLGIRIDKFESGQKEPGLYREPVEVTVMNAGGTNNGGVIGGCAVHYIPARTGNGWVVEATRLHDP